MHPQDSNHSPHDEDRLLHYFDGLLPAPEARAFESHLAACPECQALFRQWEQLDAGISRTLARAKLPPNFAARVQQRVVMESQASTVGIAVRERREAGAQSHQTWIEDRRRERSALWLGLLDGIGYGAAAAVGGYGLFRLAVAWIPGSAGTGTAFLSGPALLFALGTAGAALMFGLNLAVKNKPLRWLGAV